MYPSRSFRGSPLQLALAVCLAVTFGIGTTTAWGQAVSTGTIEGQVLDPQNAAVAGATVTVTDKATGTPRVSETNEAGRYIFPQLSIGEYDVTINKQGFAQTKFTAQKVSIGQTLTLNASLKLGAATETVEVSASVGAQLQTTNATTGTSLAGETLLLLPNLGRDVTTLLIAQPAVSPDGYSAGANYDQNMYQLDGGQNSNDMDGSMSIYTPSSGSVAPQNTGGAPSGVLPTPVESIEEFRVGTANQTADFNGSGGAQVQLATKRGTNSWHGSAYEYYLGSNFGSNTWDANFTGTPKPSTHQNRFGAAAGGPLTPYNFLGGKWYFFANYEGLRFPLSQLVEKAVPSVLLKKGIIQASVNGVNTQFNFNPANGALAACAGGPCDPRGLWLNSAIQKVWAFMPDPNDLSFGDTLNVQGFKGQIQLPVRSDFGVARIDHDFGSRWHFMASVRDYSFTRASNVQYDIGGFFPGDVKGVPAATATRPQLPWFGVLGVTTNISSNFTNDFHFSYLRNFWSWATKLAPAQVAGIPGAIEISPSFGGSKGIAESGNALIPFNVNTQSVRQRFWDGHDYYYRDDLSLIHGNHVLVFGGLVQHNWNFHTRDDNGSGTFNNPVFLVSGDSGLSMSSSFRPANITSSASSWDALYTDLLGISGAQVAYTRAGSNLALQPLGTDAFDKSSINTYNAYFSDTWKVRPTFTVTYGLGYLLETPPVEENGKQITLVDNSGNPINLRTYIATRQSAALQGQIFNPPIGYELVTNVGQGLKYPYDIFYGGFSPRVAAAWNPNFDSGIMGHLLGHGHTVVRGGYGRIYGRQNGVDLVLVPLLGVGLIQAVKCPGASIGGACLGSGATTPSTAFRIGVDPNPANLYSQGISATLPQPFFPGVSVVNGTTAARASDTLVLDPKFKPAHSDEFNVTIQRDLGHNTLLEVGYIGRILRDEYMNVNIDAIPYMLTLGGQSFANAYGNLYKSYCGLGTSCTASATNLTPTVPVQPFFESALGGVSSAYCSGFASCSQALVVKEGPPGTDNFDSQSLYRMWTHIGNAVGCTGVATCPFANSLIGQKQATSVQMSGSFGRGNYNAAFVSLSARNWKGVTVNTNFTWSRSMGTQFFAQANNGINPNNPYDLKNFGSYGAQPYDLRFVYNLQGVYQIPIYKSQSGVIGKLLGGWAVAPFFTAKSGYPLYVYTDGNISDESFGQGNPSSGNLATNAVLLSSYTGGSSLQRNVKVTGSVGSNVNNTGLSMFSNPAAVYNEFRPFILGLDPTVGGAGGGGGPIRGQSRWNMDLTVSKDLMFTERFGLTFTAQMSNLFNHPWFADPYLDLQDPADFGWASGTPLGGATQINTPRQIEFGARFHF